MRKNPKYNKDDKRFSHRSDWHHWHPPWHSKEEWMNHSPWDSSQMPMFMKARMSQRRRLFKRFAGMSVFLIIPLVAVGIVIGLFIAGAQQFNSSREILRFAVCAIPLLIPILGLIIGALSLRRVVNPLADVMIAADALAEGRFDVQVPEEGDSEFRKLARSFNDMARELERAERQRRSLTADVAHELRTPLHILRGNLEGALDGVYETTPDYLNNLLEETRLLERLVDDLQTLSLAETGALSLNFAELNVRDLLDDVRTSFLTQAEEAGILLSLDIQENEQIHLKGDWHRLDQVVSNLVANALQHTEAGGEIRLSAREDSQGVEISVQDTGIGIPAEDLPFVFDRFWKGDKSRTRSGGGSGLGLAIARQLVKAHGGGIQVESTLDQGTRFIIILPSLRTHTPEDS